MKSGADSRSRWEQIFNINNRDIGKRGNDERERDVRMAQREQVLDRAQRLQQAFVNGTLRSTWLSLVSWAPRGARLLLQIRTKCYTTIRSRRFGQTGVR